MPSLSELLAIQKRKLQKALVHLEYSYAKVKQLSTDAETLDEESLETWESFSARFSRVSELFLTRYLRTVILNNDPGFEGSLRDFLNQAEKLRIINDVHIWIRIRELRNISSHDYTEDELSHFFERLLKECPNLLSIKQML